MLTVLFYVLLGLGAAHFIYERIIFAVHPTSL